MRVVSSDAVLCAVPCSATPESSAIATVRTLRTLLLGLGLSESHSPEDEGFSITAEGRDEVSVRFNEIDRDNAVTRRRQAQRNASALLEIGRALSERRFTLTLFMSPRSLALFVRTDELEPARETEIR